VLRNYYTEKGRPFPPWLPPDPKAPAPVVAPVFAGQTQVGSRYGGITQGGQGQQGGGGSALSSLWDSGGGGAPASLRTGRGGNPFAQQQAGGGDRPLPSQRGQSYPSVNVYGRDGPSPPPPGSSSGGFSAQERLKQKLWGGGSRTGSPASGASVQQPQPQVQGRPGGAAAGGRGGSGYEGSADSYEDRFAPGGRYDPGGGQASGGNAGGGRSGGGGLPSGPRGGGGLPSGPRLGRR
jgi:hypothetical protein